VAKPPFVRRLLFHQRESGPVMAELESWMKVQLDAHKVEPNSGLGKAMQYMQRHWKGMTLFLRPSGCATGQ
jgi:transposase